MYIVNKIVSGILNPQSLGLILSFATLAVIWRCDCRKGGKARIWAICLGILSIAWSWVWSTGAMAKAVGYPLEAEFPPQPAEDAPQADAIVILGGGMTSNASTSPYAEMFGAADRVWHAARLYHAGKAPVVVPTGSGEDRSSLPLLLDLGVPREAIAVEAASRNTEENARFVRELLVPRQDGEKPRILLVTSAWHMRRAMLMFRRYAPDFEIIPAATDHETMVLLGRPLVFRDFMPSFDAAARNGYLFKEFIGYWGYRLFRL